MIRLFVALALPDDMRRRLAGFCGGVRGARWIDEANLHLTLRFIGEVGEERLEEVMRALGGVRAGRFPLTLAGAGHFESRRRVRALWIGVESSPPLNELHERVESALKRARLAADGRRFSPHITLARLNGGVPPENVRQWLQGHTIFRAAPFPVEEFVLYESLLGSGGSVYNPLAEFPLG